VHAIGNSVTRAYLRTTTLERRRKVMADCVAKLIAEHGADAKLTDLLHKLAECPKARSVSVHDRCKAVYEGL